MTESRKHVILYVHGMGGGGDSRIPSILKDNLGPDFEVVIRTYDFDPEVAHNQLAAWAKEVRPDLVIGESMGATHAIALRGYPHLFVSPSLNAPRYFVALAWMTLIPGVTALFDRIYRPRPGDRQKLHFTYKPLRKWKKVYAEAMLNAPCNGAPATITAAAALSQSEHGRNTSATAPGPSTTAPTSWSMNMSSPSSSRKSTRF